MDNVKTHATIVSHPEIMSGTPCFSGTRVPLRALTDNLADGETVESFLLNFPSVTAAQVMSALQNAAYSLSLQAYADAAVSVGINVFYRSVSGEVYGRLQSAGIGEFLSGIRARPAWDEVKVFLDIDAPPCAWLSWHPPHGYVVQMTASPATPEEFLTSGPLRGGPTVPIEIPGSTGELWPRELFVTSRLVSRFLKHFLATVRRNDRLHWAANGSFPRLVGHERARNPVR